MQKEFDIVSMFSQIASKVESKKTFENVSRDSKIASFGIDSLAMMEIIGCFEDELGVRIPDDRLATIQTVGDIERVILQSQSPAGSTTH